MELIFEIFIQVVGEILLQAVFEILVELGAHSLADTFKKPKSPALSTIGFVLWGSIAGAASLFIFPQSFIVNPVIRTINVMVTPLIAGGIMMIIGRQRDKRGRGLVRLDRFGYAFVFAFAMAIVRYFFVN
jgi:hypothetical protein